MSDVTMQIISLRLSFFFCSVQILGVSMLEGSQNRDSVVQFYDFTIQTDSYDSMTLVSKI